MLSNMLVFNDGHAYPRTKKFQNHDFQMHICYGRKVNNMEDKQDLYKCYMYITCTCLKVLRR